MVFVLPIQKKGRGCVCSLVITKGRSSQPLACVYTTTPCTASAIENITPFINITLEEHVWIVSITHSSNLRTPLSNNDSPFSQSSGEPEGAVEPIPLSLPLSTSAPGGASAGDMGGEAITPSASSNTSNHHRKHHIPPTSSPQSTHRPTPPLDSPCFRDKVLALFHTVSSLSSVHHALSVGWNVWLGLFWLCSLVLATLSTVFFSRELYKHVRSSW